MEAFFALLALCQGNSPVNGEFPSQRQVTRSFDVFFDLNKRLSKQSIHRWFETPSRSLWRLCGGHEEITTKFGDSPSVIIIQKEMVQIISTHKGPIMQVYDDSVLFCQDSELNKWHFPVTFDVYPLIHVKWPKSGGPLHATAGDSS